MKRIAIFCDGTWNRSDATHPTNVVRLAQAVRTTASDGTAQQVIYVTGVGTGRGSSEIGRRIDRLAGGAFGWGLDVNIEDAYRALVFCYEPGDEIHLFGFSRGAYTARSITGLIGRAGIVPKSRVHLIPEAMRLYRDRALKASSRECLDWRALNSPWTATSIDEIEDRKARGRPLPDVLLKIAYVGVWDTVGAMGLPNHLFLSHLVNGRYRFHDLDLSLLVARARHVVASDERRRAFEPTLWRDLATQNRLALGLPEGAGTADVEAARLPYRQEWFPGDHGAVGGGHETWGLAALACGWIAEGARDAGLEFDEAAIAAIGERERIDDDLSTLRPGLVARLWRMRDRDGPEAWAEVSEAARRRLDLAPGAYEPGAFARVLKLPRPPVRPAPPPP